MITVRPRFNVVGLGHPTIWHCSIDDDFASEEKAVEWKKKLDFAIKFQEFVPKDSKTLLRMIINEHVSKIK